jgi:hypothetical protein
MACAGCGARYRSVNNVNRQRLTVPLTPKYTGQRKPSKQPSAPVAPKSTDPQIAIGLLSSITNSIPK